MRDRETAGLRQRRGFGVIGEPQHTRFCREISFVAIYALLDVLFSAIHGDEWLFHDYDASAGLPMLAQDSFKC